MSGCWVVPWAVVVRYWGSGGVCFVWVNGCGVNTIRVVAIKPVRVSVPIVVYRIVLVRIFVPVVCYVLYVCYRFWVGFWLWCSQVLCVRICL